MDDGFVQRTNNGTPHPAYDAGEAARAASRHAVDEGDLALRLPEWDLVPPTEFIRRAR
jgi:hypothetical protein